jgi:branched-chain amino acid transport system substrate-binding protein
MCLCAFLALVLGCNPMERARGLSGPPTGPDILIGVPMALTGVQVGEAAQTRQGYDLWADWANVQGGINVAGVRHRVRLLYQDDESKPQVAAAVTQKLINVDKVQFLLGTYGSTDIAQQAAVADRAKMPLVDASGASRAIFTQGYRYVFGVIAPANQYLATVLDMAASMNPRPTTVAILSSDDSFSKEVANGAADYAPTKGLQVVYSREYPAGSTNLYPLLAEAKAKNPDMVLNSGHLVEAVALNKAARDLRFEAKLFSYSVGPSTPDFVQQLGQEANYVFGPSQWSPSMNFRPTYYLTVPEYVSAYQQKFQVKYSPSYIAAEGTAAGIALQKAIETAGSLDHDKVRQALAGLDMMTFFGRIKFNNQGQNTFRSMVVEQVQNLKRETVWPLQVASAHALYPTPKWSVRAGIADGPPAPAPKLPLTGRPPTG